MNGYTVSELAKMAGVSVRTLHYYDQIELLKPSARTAVGYRLYGEADLLRLQQILFFKELDFSLAKISVALDDPEFDQIQALREHRRQLLKRSQRLERLLSTIDKTINTLTEDTLAMKDEELYEGFSDEQVERYNREVRERFDPALVKESQKRLGRMSKNEWQALKAEGDTVTQLIAEQMEQAPESAAVQTLIARHHAMIEQFYPASAEVYSGLGEMYASHDEFQAYYEKYRSGLADFMNAAMSYYAEHKLS